MGILKHTKTCCPSKLFFSRGIYFSLQKGGVAGSGLEGGGGNGEGEGLGQEEGEFFYPPSKAVKDNVNSEHFWSKIGIFLKQEREDNTV